MALADSEKKTLLGLARASIESAVAGGPPPEPEPPGLSSALGEDAGAFVTILKDGALRGCIGTFSSPEPLYRTVIDMARSAALQDPRFMPLEPEELGSIRIEISVLSPLVPVTDPSEVVVGRHGLCVVEGGRRGVLLPQVATEHGFDRQSFLENTCLKAGLAPDRWRKGASIYTFEAEIIRED